MAIGEISLTSGMRANLQALQNTSNLLDQTQRRLATGKKVNSALDNPTNFFAAQAHTNRAADLASLKDGMSEAVQVIKAADEGISSVTAMIEAAKGLAQAATTADINFGTTDITGASVAADDTVTINGVTFTAAAGAATSTTFSVGASDDLTMASLEAAIDQNTTLSGSVTVSTTGAVTTISAAGGDIEGLTITASSTMTTSADTSNNVSGERYDLGQQYNTLMAQLDTMVIDANYKGADTNLLTSDGELKVNFEGTHNLTISGFDASTSAFSITSSTNDWTSTDDITTDIENMDKALDTLRTESKTLSSNLTVIMTRQDFSENMITTLTDGSDNLTLADMNEEGANMLMLQTRQQLGTSSLSMSSQAAQSVLSLF